MVLMKKFFFCFDLKTGGIILGSIGIIFSLFQMFILVLSSIHPDQLNKMKDLMNHDYIQRADWEWTDLRVKAFGHSGHSVVLGLLVITLAVSIVLVVGAKKNVRAYLLPYLVIEGIYLVSMTVPIGFLLFRVNSKVDLIVFIGSTFYFGLMSYIWLCMLSLYQQMTNEKKPHGSDSLEMVQSPFNPHLYAPPHNIPPLSYNSPYAHLYPKLSTHLKMNLPTPCAPEMSGLECHDEEHKQEHNITQNDIMNQKCNEYVLEVPIVFCETNEEPKLKHNLVEHELNEKKADKHVKVHDKKDELLEHMEEKCTEYVLEVPIVFCEPNEEPKLKHNLVEHELNEEKADKHVEVQEQKKEHKHEVVEHNEQHEQVEAAENHLVEAQKTISLDVSCDDYVLEIPVDSFEHCQQQNEV